MRATRFGCGYAALFSIFYFLLSLPVPALAQVTERLPDLDETATSIVSIDGRTWVATPDGAYRIDGDTATRVPDFKVDVNGIFDAAGHVWVATTQGAYRIDDGDRAVRVPDRGLVVSSVAEIGGRVWLAATNGAYLVDGDNARRVPDHDFDVAAIVPIDGLPWLATDQGAFRLTPSGQTFTAEHMVQIAYDLNQILEIDGHPWLATDQGAFRGSVTPHPNPLLGKEREPESEVTAAKPIAWQHIELITPADPSHRFTGKPAEVFRIIPVGGQIWFISASGAFRVDGDIAHRIPDAKLSVATIALAGGNIWIATRTGAYRIDGDSPHRIPDLPLDVTGVSEAAGHLWLATSTGAYEVNGDTAARIPDESVSVSSVADIGGRTFISTANGAYIVDHDRAYPVLDSDVAIMSVTNAGGAAWMATPQGAFRVDPARTLEVHLISTATEWTTVLRRLLPRGFLLAGTYGLRAVYDRSGSEPTPNPIPSGRENEDETAAADARVVATSDGTSYQQALDAGRFVEPSAVRLTLSPGTVTIHVAVKDGWLPVVERPIRARVVTAGSVVCVLLALVWLVCVKMVFVLAPISLPCHRLLMRHGFRNIGSAGLIPLALILLPSVRRYLLIRYRKQLRIALGPDDGQVTDVQLDVLRDRLLDRRVAAVAPATDTEPFVTACHVARLASSRNGVLLHPPLLSKERAGVRYRPDGLRSAIAAPLLAAGKEVRDLDALAVQLIADYGMITDRALGRWLIDHVRFLFVVEGDRIGTTPSPDETSAVKAFVERRSKRGYVCLVGEEMAATIPEPLLKPFA